MKRKWHYKMIYGYIMVLLGFILVMLTAVNYLLHLKLKLPPVVLGIIFLGVGMGWVRAVKKKGDNAGH